jgi:hypothetical protein
VIGLFKQKAAANILFVFLLGILIKLPVFKHADPPLPDEHAAILYKTIVSFLNSLGDKSGTVYAVLSYLILFTQAMQLNKLVNDHRLMQRATFLPAASYLLITSLIPEWNFFSAPLLINSLVLLVFTWLFNLYNQQHVKGVIFNIGLAIGLSSFIFFPSVILFGWLIFALMVMRTVRINEWLICLLGFVAPFYFYAAYMLITDAWNWDKLFTSFHISVPIPVQSLWLAISSSLLIIPFLIGGYFVQENLRKMLIRVRKNWSLLLIYLLFALLVPFLNSKTAGFENWILIATPFAAFHACTYLYPPQRWFPVVIFWLSILFVLAYQYIGPGW